MSDQPVPDRTCCSIFSVIKKHRPGLSRARARALFAIEMGLNGNELHAALARLCALFDSDRAPAGQHRDQPDDEENEKQNFRDADSSPGNPAETQDPRNEGDHEKNQ